MTTIIERGKKEWHLGWQEVILVPSAAFVANGVGDVYYVGDYDNLAVILAITASATAANDVLDVKLDGSWDNVTFYNMGEFTQQAGDGSAAAEMMQFRKGAVVADPDALLVITADAGATVTRPSMCPPYLRVTYTLVDGGGGDTEHSFSVKAYVQ